MANHLGMAHVQAIDVLRAQGWSFRRIARKLGIHRETVSRYVHRREAASGDGSTGAPPVKGTAARTGNVPTGSGDQNRPNPPAGSAGPSSRCELGGSGIIVSCRCCSACWY